MPLTNEFEEIKHTPCDECEMKGAIVLTIFDGGSGEIEFHAGDPGDFEREVVGGDEPDGFIIRQFWIRGYLLKERGRRNTL